MKTTIMKTANVEISVATLSAIKSILFTNDGVDLNSIVDDLCTKDENRDLVAINTALVFRGAKPEVDKTIRFESDYKSLIEYTFVSYSLIKDCVTVQRKRVAIWDDTKGDMCPTKDDGFRATFSLANWLEMNTDRSEVTSEIIKRWKK